MRRLALLALVALAGCGGSEGNPQAAVSLRDLNGSGLNGSATVTRVTENTSRVEIEIDPPDSGGPAFIYIGGCNDPEVTPVVPLSPLVNGRSSTVVELAFGELTAISYVIGIRRSATDDTMAGCGELLPG